MKPLLFNALAALLALVLGTGCATRPSLAPLPADGQDPVIQHAADVLILAARDTRRSGREIAGWCWSDSATGRLQGLERAGVGNDVGVGLALPLGRRGNRELSCSWHTHPWDPRVVPGPSRRDLSNSSLSQVSEIDHFVVDRHGIWRYARGRLIIMCPWNSAGTNFDAERCRF